MSDVTHTSDSGTTHTDRCPTCGHRSHGAWCANLASDNDCSCTTTSREFEAQLALEVEAVETEEARWQDVCQAVGEAFYESEWLAAHDRAARAGALNEAADEVRRIRENGLDEGMTTHPTAEHFEQWLRACADLYLREGLS